MPDSSTLVSASEDCTIKVWNLGQLAELPQMQQVCDMEPYLTIRGHTGPILSIGTLKNGRSTGVDTAGLEKMLFSGGGDGSIHLWRVPSLQEALPYGATANY